MQSLGFKRWRDDVALRSAAPSGPASFANLLNSKAAFAGHGNCLAEAPQMDAGEDEQGAAYGCSSDDAGRKK
jgi:hypothetical protein